ncbi:MAG: hypothetical protein SFV32_09295 [Opitutaceae bacterium]|nr:hypothetical protein [Opitutaceae bacterium]
MALAKYFEDLVEDCLDGRRWMFEPQEKRDPAREWRALQPEPKSTAVRLCHDNGVAWDDGEAFTMAEPVTARVEVIQPEVRVTLSWKSVRGIGPQITPTPGGVRITASQVNSGDLLVSCGNYTKVYRVSFTQRERLESLPDFSLQLSALVDNPPSWTQATFDSFREGVDKLLQKHTLPEDFCYGVREFYLGLYHERLGEIRFGDRLDRAAVLLRPFLGHSRLALMICSYYMYRVNAFEHPLANLALKRISRAARFFVSGAFSPDEVATEHPIPASKPKILISAADHEMMDAVNAMDQGHIAEFWRHAEAVASCISPHDQQGRERFNFLRAQACKATGDLLKAKSYSVNLAQSTVPSFRALATQLR